jgi:hypothetical protein
MIVGGFGIFLGLRTRERVCLTTTAFVTPRHDISVKGRQARGSCEGRSKTSREIAFRASHNPPLREGSSA